MLKRVFLYIMSLAYVLAGCYHFIWPGMYLAIMPAFLPAPLLLIYISGVMEIMLGALLLPPATRRVAAWGLIILLIAVFPANIQMAVNFSRDHHPKLWLALLRLPLQLLLIYLAHLYTKPPDAQF